MRLFSDQRKRSGDCPFPWWHSEILGRAQEQQFARIKTRQSNLQKEITKLHHVEITKIHNASCGAREELLQEDQQDLKTANSTSLVSEYCTPAQTLPQVGVKWSSLWQRMKPTLLELSIDLSAGEEAQPGAIPKAQTNGHCLDLGSVQEGLS